MAPRQSKAGEAAREHAKWAKQAPRLYKMAQAQTQARRQREIEIAGRKSRAIFEHMLSEGIWPLAKPSLVDEFKKLDHRLHWATYYPDSIPMSDEDYDQLAGGWAAAAKRVVDEPVDNREALATKLDVVARVFRTFDGEIGKAELGMARQIVSDVEQLLSDDAREEGSPGAG
jgi:hypothetical protein